MTPGPLGDAVAHHPGPGRGSDHGEPFRAATAGGGLDASGYFARSGLARFADEHGGLCTFRLDGTLCLLQTTNAPLVDDDALAPSTDTNRALFGEFMGGLHHSDPRRAGKRDVVERTLGNGRFVRALEPSIREATAGYLRTVPDRGLDTAAFATGLVAHVDSVLPGVLDLRDRPLTGFLGSPAHGRVALRFFEIASEVISTVNPDAMDELDMVVPFVRELLVSNARTIAAAPASNLIRRQFALWGLPFDAGTVAALPDERVKELGTVLVAVYDTTALSLTWLLDHLENAPERKAELLAALHDDTAPATGPSVAEQCVLEAVRLGGSNPTALWRRTLVPVPLTHRGRSATIPAGTMLWLDRWHANRDPAVFADPGAFDPAHVRELVRSPRETVSSLLSRNRYEINSFSMVNTRRNPRKCPGRLFSVQVQATVLEELYRSHDVVLTGGDLSLRPHSAMPRPHRSGHITIAPLAPAARNPEVPIP